MKKSTLITTIAMIVVVVVALSTATYAWFSSSTSAVATSATITTTAAGDWTIAKGNITENQGTYTYVIAAASDSITLNTTGLNQGLWSPIGEINTAFTETSVGVSGGIVNPEQFIEARVNNGGNLYHQTSETILPDILKLSNAQQSPKNLRLSVVLNAGSDTTKVSSFYACAAVRFVAVFEVMNGTTKEVYTVSNAYGYCDTVGYTDSACQTAADARVEDTTFEKQAGTAATDSVNKKTVINNINYAAAATVGAGAQFKQYNGWGISVDNLTKYGIGEQDYVYMYNYDLPVPVAVGQSTNVLIYTWIDGWQAATEAAGSSFTVNYAFNTAGAVTSGNE